MTNNPDMQPTVTEALEPCPFCGGDEGAFENLYDDENDEIQKCWTVVHECPALRGSNGGLPPIVVMRDTEAEAIAAWNTRAPSQETARSADVGRSASARAMDSAPKDGSYIVAYYKSLDGYAESLDGRAFVVRHEGQTASGYDLGWALFPGHGGVPDKCFSGWAALPTLTTPPADDLCPKCGGTHVRHRNGGDCSGPPLPSSPPTHTPMG